MIRLISTEKAVRELENNVLLFSVDKWATKADVKKEIETQFNVKVASVNMFNTISGDKRCYVKLGKEYSASDIADKIGGAV